MPASRRNNVAEQHRTERRESLSSPYNQRGRKEKMASSRGWSSSIWTALAFWRRDPPPSSTSSSSDEDSSSVELLTGESVERKSAQSSNGNGLSSSRSRLALRLGKDFNGQAQESNSEEGSDLSPAMNSSTTSEDQVLGQLMSPIPRQVRFQLPDYSHHTGPIPPQHSQAASTSSSHRRSPYVAPLPPLGIQMQTQMGQPQKDPLATVSEYLDNVVLPRGGECTNVEALGLSMLIQSSVKGSTPSTLSQDNPSNHFISTNRSPFVFPAAHLPAPLKPTFTSPSTDTMPIYSRPISPSTANSSNTTFSAPSSSLNTSSVSRTMTYNPNGNVFFQGGGSARRRYRSQAFGAPSARKKFTFSSTSRDYSSGEAGSSTLPVPSDGKRRRVDDGLSSSSLAQPSGPSSYTVPSSSSLIDAQPTTKESAKNGAAFFNGSSTSAHTSTAASTARFTSTPARPSPLRQSTRADSSSPGSASSNQGRQGSPETRTNGDVAKAGQAKALAIFAQIVNNASQPDNDDKALSSNVELVNPYDTRPTTKRTRRPARPARLPPPRPTRRAVSAEIQLSQMPSAAAHESQSPKKRTALETIEESAPPFAQANKRAHRAETSVERRTISRSESETTNSPVPVSIIDVDADDVDVDMSEAATSGSIVRPSEVIEPIETERDMSPVSAQQQAHLKPALSARILYPSSLSKGPGRFGTMPKEPSPLRNSFQPDQEAEAGGGARADITIGAAAAAATDFTLEPAQPQFQFQPQPQPQPQPESKSIPMSFGSKSVSARAAFTVDTDPTTATTTTGESAFGKASSEFGFSVFKVPVVPSTSTSTSTEGTSASVTNGFTFGQTSAFANKPFTSFAAGAGPSISSSSSSPSPFTIPITPIPSGTSRLPPPPAHNVINDIEAVKDHVLSLEEYKLPVFSFNVTVNTTGVHKAVKEGVAALEVPEKLLPSFTFDKKPVSGTNRAGTGSGIWAGTSALGVGNQLASTGTAFVGELPKSEIKGFDWAAAGIKLPVSAGWTCSMCYVSNKDTDSKCACCGEDKP